MTQQTHVLDPQAAIKIGSIGFPQELVGCILGDVINNELERPGLGFTIPYDRPGFKATIYVYDLEKESILEGPTSDTVHQELEQAISDIYRSAPQTGYDKIDLGETYYSGHPDLPSSFAAATFSIQKGNDEFPSFLYLTGYGGNFVKIRITETPEAGEHQMHELFVAALSSTMYPQETIQ